MAKGKAGSGQTGTETENASSGGRGGDSKKIVTW